MTRANQLREQLNPDRPSPGQLNEIDRLQSEALAVKDRIVQMNLRLVISIAKAHVRGRLQPPTQKAGRSPTAISPLAGKRALKEMLVDLTRLERESFNHQPDLDVPDQPGSFGTSEHRA